MNTGTTWATAGLVFTKFRELDIVQIANRVGNSFEALGHRVTGANILSDRVALVTTKNHNIHLKIEDDVELTALDQRADCFLSVSISNGLTRRVSSFARDSILARVLQTLHTELSPSHVKWIDSEVVLSSTDFARAVGAPRKPRAKKYEIRSLTAARKATLPDIEQTHETLEERFEAKDPIIVAAHTSQEGLVRVFRHDQPLAQAGSDGPEETQRLRLSAWLISISVAMFALPIGVMLVVYNLLRGENLRLASQTAALTGTFVALQAYGSTAQAMTAIQRVLG